MDYVHQLLILCPFIFFAGFVDSIVGGGGIITLPAYYLVGVPPHMALGTNKFSSAFGTAVAAYRFLKGKKVHLGAAAVSVITALIGSAIGASCSLFLTADALRYILIISLPFLAFFILKNKNFGKRDEKLDIPIRKVLILSGIIGLVIGWYDGFFGPGAGTFLILAFNAIVGFDLITSSGNAKMVNLASNVAALITFLISGNIIFALGIPAAICSIGGNYLGSSLAIKNGAKIIRPLFIFVFILLLMKILYDIVKSM